MVDTDESQLRRPVVDDLVQPWVAADAAKKITPM